ncbi:MAG: oligoribonuclease [Thiotrichales bacterium]|nr:oligoribonuclease [Thiotrichales bacterium]
MKSENHLIWIDLEMTGLDPQNHRILEIATVVTDAQLNILAEGPVLAIQTPAEELAKMDQWCQTHHGKSGLTARVENSQVSLAQAEQLTLAFLSDYIPAGKSPMCGNSICQDRRFLAQWMPTLEGFFHYRNLDVSTLKELARRWAPQVYSAHQKKGAHLALEDIIESIDELKHYRQTLFAETFRG